MTEYGRGAGSEPWHPEDPLYGDQGWGGQQDASGQTPYDGQAQQYAGAPQYDQYGNPVYSTPQDPYQQQYPQQQGQYPQQTGVDPNQYGAQQDQYGQAQYGQDQYGRNQPPYPQDQNQQPYGQNPNAQQYQQQYAQSPYQQPPYPQDPYPQQNGGWEGAAQQTGVAYGAEPHTPYAGQPVHHNGENPDFYRTPDAYPPPQPPGRRDEWQQEPPAEAEPEPPHEPETHPFFTGGDGPLDGGDDDDYDDDPAETRDGTRDRRGKTGKPKRRKGCACFAVSLVLVGGLGGLGYAGYEFYQSRYAPPPDYTGVGSSPVQVEVPTGTGLGGIGRLLKEKGVVKSVQAFVTAAGKNPKGKSLQAGVYSLNQRMSAANAVTAMVDPNSLNQLIIPPGWRNATVYAAIDKRLELKAGTTAGVAKSQAGKLGLPGWAKGHKDLKDPLEGFLAPASYPVATGMKPEDLLKKMVGQADKEYGDKNLAAAATRLGLKDPFQVVTVASLVQAEGKTQDDFRRMAEVIYNRLKPENTQTNQLLQFDSTYNYLKRQSKINIGEAEIHKNMDPYNTYTQKGLPPGPIGSPGPQALAAALNPTKDGYLYFVSVDGHQTGFTKTYAEFMKLKQQFNDNQNGG
ncbi:endolytic transglycosylase MltG [Streptomyces sp. SID10853]|uniref:endolytic transglycosylase MltG n=1 Tax=Streptomyces sp. SID10853 TaxID=2706028 RepID=UPI0013C0A449|nr:endolytic transglycosylase MltG [Streptomyces sp. SID10853]NDZ81126.1 endolytic transglycosylase MltG [Streptomyces sp. SID10853]